MKKIYDMLRVLARITKMCLRLTFKKNPQKDLGVLRDAF